MTLHRFACPPGLLGASVFFWGFQLNLWPLGLAGAVLLEAANKISWRIDIDEKLFIRLSDFTSLAIVGTGVWFFLKNSSDGLFLLVQWLPAIMFVLLAAQCLSHNGQLPLTAIVATLRKRSRLDPSIRQRTIDLRLPYVFITLIAASMAAPRTQVFYVFTALLILWFLWKVKPNHHKPIVWLLYSTCAVLLGLLIHIGINQLRGTVQDITTQWLQSDWSNRNLNRNSTAIGQIGRLKMSEEIIMRIRNTDKKHFKSRILLQQVEYNRYVGGSWYAEDRSIKNLSKQPGTNSWYLRDEIPATKTQLRISTYLQDGEGILALPRHSFAINYDKTANFSINNYGSVQIENAAGLLDFSVDFAPDRQPVDTVSDKDLEIPQMYEAVLAEVVNELGLDELTAKQAAIKLQNYFDENFKYTLVQNELDLVFNPLSHFLRKSRKGHCEYFATAGVLILRAAGIPSRYASGFLMSEYDADKDLFIVRARHAHAWTLAYIGGTWVELDYTPSTWVELEAEAAPWWEGVYDTLSNMTHTVYQWWNGKPRNLADIILMFVLLVTSVYLLWKTPFKKILLPRQGKSIKKHTLITQGNDSPFYKIIHYLEQNTAAKQTGESLKAWLLRISISHNLDLDALIPLVDRHYQYRFSHTAIDKEKFDRDVEGWLVSHTKH